MRAFVVGNGPSLAVTPLDKLAGDVSFGVNGIRRIYKSTGWRPTYYVRAEEASTQSPEMYREDISLHLDICKEVWANLWFTKNADFGKHPKYRTIVACDHYTNHFDEARFPHLYHMPLLCTAGSSVNVAIQIAVQKGYDPIYLVGCDLGYKDGQPSHFTPDYEQGAGKLRAARWANMDTLAAHMVAARTWPGRIINATIGGNLEAYERINFLDLFK